MIGVSPATAALLAALVVLPSSQEQALLQTVRDARGEAAPALGVVVAHCAGDIERAQDGQGRIDQPSPLAEHARYNIGSNSKSMLATLAATFVEQGELRWDTRVEEVFADEAGTLDPVLREVTLEQLLAHRAGLAAYASGAELSAVQVTGETPTAQRLAFALQVLRAPPAQAPDSGFVYSNAGYVIAGAMLERVGGAPFEALMRARVFAPLGMDHATFGDPAPGTPGQPVGHLARDGQTTPYLDSDPAIPPFLQPAGNVSLTLADYGAYLREHLCGLEGKPTGLLAPETIQFLHRPRGEEGASLGWGRYAFHDVPASIHIGGTGVFTAYVAVLPSRDLAVATVTNSGAPEAGRAALSLMRAVITERTAQDVP